MPQYASFLPSILNYSNLYFILFIPVVHLPHRFALVLRDVCVCLASNPSVCAHHTARWSILCVVLSQSWCRGCVLYIRVTLIILFLLLFTSVIILSSPPSQRHSLPAPHLISSLCQPFVGNKIHADGALQHNYPKYDTGLFGLELSPSSLSLSSSPTAAIVPWQEPSILVTVFCDPPSLARPNFQISMWSLGHHVCMPFWFEFRILIFIPGFKIELVNRMQNLNVRKWN